MYGYIKWNYPTATKTSIVIMNHFSNSFSSLPPLQNMSSKASEEKVAENSDEDVSDEEPEYTLLYKANKFLGKEIDGMTQSFINEYAHEFDVEEDEHKLVFTELHLKYVKMFENMLEDFVVEECPNMSRLQAFRIFFGEAKSSITGQFQPLFAEEECTAP